MKNIILGFLLFLSTCAFGDETLYIVNRGQALPKIIIKDLSHLNDTTLQKNFYNLMLNDLKVSSNFEVLTSGDEKGNYVLEYTLDQSGSSLNLNVIVKADGAEKSKRKYMLTKIEQYPFLAHKGIKESVRDLGLAPVEWMDHKILIARANGSGKSQIIMADYTLTYQTVVVSGGLNLFPKWECLLQVMSAKMQTKFCSLWRLRTNQIFIFMI